VGSLKSRLTLLAAFPPKLLLSTRCGGWEYLAIRMSLSVIWPGS